MTFLNSLLLAAGGSLAGSILVKATLVLALELALAFAARRGRAANRHAILAAAFAVLAALPVFAALLPPLRVRLEPQRQAIASRITGHPASFGPVRPRPAPAKPSAISAFDVALLLWSLGAATSLFPVALGLWQIRRLRRAAQPWERGNALTAQLAAQTGLARAVDVRLHETLAGPITCGILRPAIVLPCEAETWDEAALERAILHELEHVRRADWAVQCLARIVCSAYWFHPLAWMARTRLALEAERACDDAVVAHWDATAYADQLVALAARLSGAAKLPALSMASRADLGTRVAAMLDVRQPRGRASRRQLAFTCAAAAVLALCLAPIRTVAAPQQRTYTSASNLVVEDIYVTDKSGNVIPSLTAADFTLTDNGVPQTVALCEFQKLANDSADVKSYYVLGYYPTNDALDGSFHRIVVKLASSNASKIDFRTGYYAGKNWNQAATDGVAKGVPDGVKGGVAGGLKTGVTDKRPGVFGGVRSADGVFGPAPNQADDSGITDPIPVFKAEPEYSEDARKAKFQGTAVVLVDVDVNGRVTRATILRSLGLGLDEKAVEAALKWRFRPATRNGVPIAMQRQIEMSFRLL